MSSPRNIVPSLSLNGEAIDEEGVELTSRKDSTVAKLRRLASNPNYQKDSTVNLGTPDIITNIRLSAADAANKLQSILESPTSASHADIRRLVEKEYHKSSASKELLRHLVFLVILIAGITLHRSAYESYLLNQALITSFITQQIDADLQPFPKTFMDVGQPDEFADWFISVLGGTLDTNTFYNNQSMTQEQQNYVMWSNRLVGGVRIRQLRNAWGRGCQAPHQLRAISNGTCLAYTYSGSTRDTEPFGPPGEPNKYTYQTQKETGSVGFFGYILDYIDGGGYVVDVNIEAKLNGTSYTEAFQELLDEMWIDRQTRAVIISMVFLNLELESRVGVLYLLVELPGNGVYFPNYMIKTFRLDMYVLPLDYFRAVLEVLFFLFLAYSIYTEGFEMINNYRRQGFKGLKKYFYNGWNVIELVDIGLYVTVTILYVKYLAAPERYNAKLDSVTYSSDMERLAAIALGFYNVCAFNVILTTFRTFKYLKLNHRLYLLWKTLRHAGMDLIGFLFIFLIFIFGFIFMGWLSFGSDLSDFNTFVHSFATCWNFIIGNAPDYDAMYASNRILGPCFFVLFTIFIFFILANMFIAILSNSFEVVNDSDDKDAKLKDILEEKITEVVATFKKFYNIVTKKDAKKRPITEILDSLAHPEILDEPNLTRNDIAKAIGETATQTEIDDLYQWVRKLEAKRNNRRSSRADTMKGSKGLMADYEEEDAPRGTIGRNTLGRTSDVPSSPSQEETKAALRDLQGQMQELKSLINRLSGNPNSNNNNL